MRERSPQRIADLIRSNYAKGINFYFFTDDNFARKKLWRETFESIIKLREEGIKIEFMMQVDLARKPKDFVTLAAQSGCSQVFIGMESVNPKNLAAEGKGQNNVDEYAQIVSEWQRAGVEVHTGYIIGLPHDTKEQVTRDVHYLMREVQPDQASFFMLTPLPGSHDHREMKKQGVWMDADFNKRDSFHATIEHPNMTAEEWTEAYNNAWKSFYSKENLARILARWRDDPKRYWSMMGNLLWYKNAALIERQHPMIAGFFRMKDRRIRRSGFAVDSLPVHLWKRTKEVSSLLVAWVKLLKEFEEIWLQTRKMSATEERWLTELEKIQGEIWQTLRIRELQEMYQRAGAALPAKARRLLSSLDDLSSRSLLSAKDLTVFVKRWQKLQERIQDLQKTLSHESEQAQRTVEEFCRVLKNTKPKAKIHDWQESYRRLRQDLPSRLRMGVVRFDALSNRIIVSRQDLHNFWDTTVHSVKAFRFWRIPPYRLLTALIKDFSLTASFASELQANRARID
jgi:hypothetical protein